MHRVLHVLPGQQQPRAVEQTQQDGLPHQGALRLSPFAPRRALLVLVKELTPHSQCCCGLTQCNLCPCIPSSCDCRNDCDNCRFNNCVCSSGCLCCDCICDPCACCMGPYKGDPLQLEREIWEKHHNKANGAPQADEDMAR